MNLCSGKCLQLKWHLLHSASQKDGLLSVSPEHVSSLWLSDMDDSSPVKAEMISLVQPQSKIFNQTRLPAKLELDNPSYEGRRGFIRTTKDLGMPVGLQDMMIQLSGSHWDVKDMESDHDPFISHPEELAKLLHEYAGKFATI